MKYHDNDICFTAKEGYSIIGGSYKIDDFYVTDGQDPGEKDKQHSEPYISKEEGKNLHVLSGDGKLTFRVGRKESESVANWFFANVPQKNTNFAYHQNQKKMNFAFIGVLKLAIGNGVTGRTIEYVFENFAIAQASERGRNQWWIGGPKNTNIGGDTIETEGKTGNGKSTYIRMERTDKNGDANHVNIYPDETACWMQWLREDATLNQVMMPGSHDAGMSELHHADFLSGGGAISGLDYISTQKYPVARQLRYGSRYFDLRADYDHGKLVTYHRDGNLGANGQDLETVLNEARDFVQKFKTEVVILKFSHIRTNRGDEAGIKSRIESLLKKYDEVLYKNIDGGALPFFLIRKMRGKIVAVFDYDEYISTKDGRWRYHDYTYVLLPNLTVFDEYSNTAAYETMQQDQIQKWRKQSPMIGGESLFLLSWTLTPNPVLGTPTDKLAKIANEKLSSVLHAQLDSNTLKKPNIVYVDFLDLPLAKMIIQFNDFVI